MKYKAGDFDIMSSARGEAGRVSYRVDAEVLDPTGTVLARVSAGTRSEALRKARKKRREIVARLNAKKNPSRLRASASSSSAYAGTFTIAITRGPYGGDAGLSAKQLEAIGESVAAELNAAFAVAGEEKR